MKGQFTRSRTGIKLSLIDTNSQSISRNWVTILGVCTEFRSYSTLRNFVEFCYNKASITYITIPRQTIVFHRFNFPCLLSLKATIHTPNKPIKKQNMKKEIAMDLS